MPNERPKKLWLYELAPQARAHLRTTVVPGRCRAAVIVPRSRNAHLLGNVALLRNTMLAVLAEHHAEQSLPPLLEHFHAQPHCGLRLLRA